MDGESEDRVDKVVAWRQQELERAGFDPTDALRLASSREVDLHRAIELIDAGCPAATAVEILT